MKKIKKMKKLYMNSKIMKFFSKIITKIMKLHIIQKKFLIMILFVKNFIQKIVQEL